MYQAAVGLTRILLQCQKAQAKGTEADYKSAPMPKRTSERQKHNWQRDKLGTEDSLDWGSMLSAEHSRQQASQQNVLNV